MKSEHEEQVALVQWLMLEHKGVWFFAIPNGGLRHKLTAAKLKAEGVRAGVPDLFIPEWRLWVEMKRQSGGRLSTEQKRWLDHLNSVGYATIVGHGFEDAKEKIEIFLKKQLLTKLK